MGAFLLFPLGVTIVDDVLRKVSGLQAAADLVKVADSAPGRRRDEDGPVVKSVFAIRAVASGELGNPNREVAWGDLEPRVWFVYNFILGLRCRSKARGVGYGMGTQMEGSTTCKAREGGGYYLCKWPSTRGSSC